MKKYNLVLFLFVFAFAQSEAQTTFQIALLKYNGGGDWYANPTSLTNLIDFCNKNLKTSIKKDYATVDVGSAEIFNYPFVHLTGHGNVIFNNQEALNLRNYLLAGGFLHISDNYGIDKYLRPQMKKVFPELDFVLLPFDFPIYHQKFSFQNGLPKIHEHDGTPPEGYGLLWEGRLVCFYDYECDLGDGWEDPDVHKDSPEKRLKALQMGANILQYVFTR